LGSLERVGAMEKDILGRYNGAIQMVSKGELTEAKFAELLEREILPAWTKHTEDFCAIQDPPAALAPIVSRIAEYLQLRQKSMELLLQAIRENDGTKVELSQQKAKAADNIVKEMASGASKPRPYPADVAHPPSLR
jgi:hypothetical protein